MFTRNYYYLEAMQFIDNSEQIKALSEFIVNQDLRISYKDPEHPYVILNTLNGEMYANVGDWIIKGDGDNYFTLGNEHFSRICKSMEVLF